MSNSKRTFNGFGAGSKKDEANENLSRLLDEALVVDKSERPWFFTRWMLKQAGGYSSEYYTASEARSASSLAAAKMVSVGFATFSFMKAVSPAFDSEAIQSLRNLPGLNDVDPKIVATAAAASFLWWTISTIDTAVLHGMRSSKAAKAVFNEHGIGDKAQTRSGISGPLLRYGISLGSLGITIPALLITVSEDTIDQYLLKTRYNETNDAIIQKYTDDLEAVDAVIAGLDQRRLALVTERTSLQEAKRVVSEAQETRLQNLSQTLTTLTEQKIVEEAKLPEQERLRDLAAEIVRQEREGLGDAVPGCRPEVPVAPKCDEAIAELDAANARIETINTAISRYDTQIKSASDEIVTINAAIATQTENENAIVERERARLTAEITNLTTRIDQEVVKKLELSDVNAMDDPRYLKFNPDMAERVEGYIEYMRDVASPLEWTRAAAMTLIIACLELGVFALAASRRLNPGEMRGYLASVLKSDQAADIFKTIKETQKYESSTLEGSNGILRRKARMEEAQADVFEEVLKKVKEDPEMQKRVLDDVMAYFEEIRKKSDFSSKPENGPKP